MNLPQYSSLHAYALFTVYKLLLKEGGVFHFSQFQTSYGAVPENKKPKFQDCMNLNNSVNIQSALVQPLEVVNFHVGCLWPLEVQDETLSPVYEDLSIAHLCIPEYKTFEVNILLFFRYLFLD